ncbi:hypothetical protein, conserved [Plasmodium gonderi]|uniref:Uncharacterized protein n=1 Tax=Plasmodium gonderi TaxID=77519 RepID=A0A1Y1JJU0_PLAGO|nr:hypothetical protein, conserved [Plasmodium gonderi]GAW82786.1 hypothetical protein, conserved [Plasmodium gonderi]
MLKKVQILILLIIGVNIGIIPVHSVKMKSLHVKFNESLHNCFNKITSSNSRHHKRNNVYAYLKHPYLHIHQRKINYLKNTNCIYSKYYNNEPVYNTYNPILNYDVLDVIKVYGRFAEHGYYESLNIIIDIKDDEGIAGEKTYGMTNEGKDTEGKENGISDRGNENENRLSNDGTENENRLSNGGKEKNRSEENKKGNNNWIDKFFTLIRFKDKNERKEIYWYRYFLKYGKMNFTDFKKHLLHLKFKWPKDSLFPTYNIFLFEKGLSKNVDSPHIRTKVENYIQHQEINENLLKTCFYCFSQGKEYITAQDILKTFIGWRKYDKNKHKEEGSKFWSFFSKGSRKPDSIDWFMFKNKIDSCTIRMHQEKK